MSERTWAGLTVADLKAELVSRGLSNKGTKKILIARLVEDDGEDDEEEEEPDVQELAPEPQGEDYHSKSVGELKAELTRRDLLVSGPKAVLIDRLEANDANPEAGKKKQKKRAHAEAFDDDPLLQDKLAMEDAPVDESGEQRAKPWISAPDDEYKRKLAKVRKERLFMLDRKKSADRYGSPTEKYDIAGSTGNVYKVTIGREPKCDCMDARIRGQKCKHIKYALIIILKAPAHLCYQNAFLASEIRSIFANAPVTQAPVHDPAHNHQEDESFYTGKRKPIDGECPICVFDMEPGEELVWCKAACGQNFHKECFEQWKRSKHGGRVTCVYCRTEWQEDVPRMATPSGLAALKDMAPKVGSYRNVAGLMPQYVQTVDD